MIPGLIVIIKLFHFRETNIIVSTLTAGHLFVILIQNPYLTGKVFLVLLTMHFNTKMGIHISSKMAGTGDLMIEILG